MAKNWVHGKVCRLCNSRNVAPVLKFAFTPPEVITKSPVPENPDADDKVPLIISLCEKCRHVQMLDVVKPPLLFDDNPLFDGDSAPSSFYESLARDIVDRGRLKKGDVIVDIGSGNGMMLSILKNLGFKVLGVDPNLNAFEASRKNGIHHYREYFTPTLANQIVQEHGKVSAVISTFVLGSVDNLYAFASGVRHMLKQDGLFFFAESYLGNLLKSSAFYQITHDRISLFSAIPLVTFFRAVLFHLIDVKHITEFSGCIVGTVQRSDGPHVTSPSLTSVIEEEEKQGIATVASLNAFAARAEEKKQFIMQSVQNAMREGRTVAGLGATSRSVTFIHECEWRQNTIQCVIDDDPRLIGNTMPGTDIPIASWETARSGGIGALVILGELPTGSMAQSLDAFRQSGGVVIAAD